MRALCWQQTMGSYCGDECRHLVALLFTMPQKVDSLKHQSVVDVLTQKGLMVRSVDFESKKIARPECRGCCETIMYWRISLTASKFVEVQRCLMARPKFVVLWASRSKCHVTSRNLQTAVNNNSVQEPRQ